MPDIGFLVQFSIEILMIVEFATKSLGMVSATSFNETFSEISRHHNCNAYANTNMYARLRNVSLPRITHELYLIDELIGK